MKNTIDSNRENPDFKRPIAIADGVFWVGFFDAEAGLHCNPYLIIDGDEAVVIDAGSRPDFPTIMMKILQTGVIPGMIRALIHHHYDPDLCGAIPNLEEMIARDDLILISARPNHMFIRHYSTSSRMTTLNEIGFKFRFSSGRELRFIPIPFSHAHGSFMTLDTKSKTLFTSDLFGSYSKEWDLFSKLAEECADCTDTCKCTKGLSFCPVSGILDFHKMLFPTHSALRYALKKVLETDFEIIAPQHGSVISRREDATIMAEKLLMLPDVGIETFLKGDPGKIFSSW